MGPRTNSLTNPGVAVRNSDAVFETIGVAGDGTMTVSRSCSLRSAIFKVTARASAEPMLEGVLEGGRACEPDRLRNSAKRLLPLREPTASFIQTELLHKVPRRFPKNTLKYFAEMAGTHA